ncbi:lipid-A-disaccharide synthase [Rickettsia parkeri str. Tate's Hell]|uniref:Lipid-A-disaccharide synthase n=2 Tax=Rickettsia parkeri TaxID=35792 RepID=A0ABR5DR55_RICPA|nr:lipid-A-disaccharide synthase [Rickettsia parkeri]AFC74632.1 lipid-A-disaccharide synthase [Rickettsia parkeri str. Portsmouth]KJV93405.1 lipid-A-disaccharide synthase [Rickettsia parkeri str. Grand Bay]KJW01173.1 lipid-A-disaccharide synthase [Rickettsia parkeri str. Tate's Hell]
MTKIYFIAGEVSGDFVGGRIMQHLKNNTGVQLNSPVSSFVNDAVQFVGVGGKYMEEAGSFKSLFPITSINLMGFVEILPHIFKLKKLIDKTVEDIINSKADLLITIDSPGFTYRVAKRVRKLLPKLKMIHIVAPSVWAYKEGRAVKYAKIYDCLFALLPFEPPYFTKVGLDCRYIGHPIMEQEFYSDKIALREEFKIDENERVLCVTLGSRKGEILRHLSVFVSSIEEIFKSCNNLKVIFTLANPAHEAIIKPFLEDVKFNYLFSSERLKTYAVADVALAKSGTNTLEIAASGTPMIVAYKVNLISFFIIRLLIKIKYVTLINIIADKEIVPEFIQFNCRANLISNKLQELLFNSKKAYEQVIESQKILQQLGFKSNRLQLNSESFRHDEFKGKLARCTKVREHRLSLENSLVSSDRDDAVPSYIAAAIIKQEFLEPKIKLLKEKD